MAYNIELTGTTAQRALWADQDLGEVAFVGPLGCGKTYALAVKQLLLRFANPQSDGLLVVPTFSMATAIHKTEWPQIWDSLGVPVVLLDHKDCFVWPWGRRTWIRSGEKPDRYKGINAGDVTFDEPGQMSREAYDVGAARARHPKAQVRQVVLGGTPEGMNWFADLFAFPEQPRRTIRSLEWHHTMSHYKAHLEHLYGYDQSLLAAYGRGEFVPLRVGRAYSMFSRLIHCGDVEFDEAMPLVLATDFNVGRMRWLVMQIAPRRIEVLDEIALGSSDGTIEAVGEFISRWGCRHRRVTVVGDAAGNSRSSKGSKTDYQIIFEELQRAEMKAERRVPPSNPFVKDSVDAVNYHFAGRGREVCISSRCKELVLDLERVVWKDGRNEIDKSDSDRTHSSDALRYAVYALARPLRSTGRVGRGVVAGRGNPAYAAW